LNKTFLRKVPGTVLEQLHDVDHTITITNGTATATGYRTTLYDNTPELTSHSFYDHITTTIRFVPGAPLPEYRWVPVVSKFPNQQTQIAAFPITDVVSAQNHHVDQVSGHYLGLCD
jgi:hypothetical protein